MLIHAVYFWLKPGLAAGEVARFVRGLRSLAAIGSVQRAYVGTPAATVERGVVDASFSYALTVFFADVAAHDAYQVDPLHARFLAECSTLWREVRVYDAVGDDHIERLGE
ncbi:MAG TPA: Dabb family protein [Planctomycetota bacterium]|nr:Dabb family protein [Planctomycetota bacterium]